jgi:hypothetical protein
MREACALRQRNSRRYLLFNIAGAVLAAARVKAKKLFEVWGAGGEKAVGEIQKLARGVIDKDHAQIAIHDRNPAWEIVEDNLQQKVLGGLLFDLSRNRRQFSQRDQVTFFSGLRSLRYRFPAHTPFLCLIGLCKPSRQHNRSCDG